MKIKKIILIFLLFPMFVLSQNKTVTGLVNDENSSPLPGATVQLKGSESIGAITDFDGNFTISIPSNSDQILIISYIGYLNEEINVTNQISITVNLQPDTEALEEVVVVGYGTVLKRDLTGSVSSVKIEDDVSRAAATVDQLLQGRAAGVQVTQNAANPNSGVSVRIRGTNSLRGNNEPLYVIDGVIISSAGEDVSAVGTGNTGQDPQSGLNGINPRDIERIEILKDASATAIYGSRGANGVVLITTKSGSKEDGKGKFNAYFTTSISEITKTYDMLDGVGYANYSNAARAAAGESPRYTVQGDNVFSYLTNPDGTPSDSVDTTPNLLYDWQDYIYQQGISSNLGLTFSGASDAGDYYLSAGFNDMNGLIDNASFKTTDLRLNLNYDINEKLRVEARFSAFFSESDFAEGGDLIGGDQSFVQQTVTYNPIRANGLDDLSDFYDDNALSNPISWIDDFTDESKENRMIASLAIKYKFNVPGLQYEFRVGGNLRDKDRTRFYGLTTWQGANANGLYQQTKLNALTYQANNFLRYNRNINRNHRVNATLGVTYDVRDVSNSTYAVQDFVTAQLGTAQPFLGQVISSPLLLRAADQQLFSVLGRVNYTFKNKYVITASFRRDGVSKFSEDNRYGFFPSFAFAWRAGSEKFIQNLDLFSSLKFRAGWGQIGNHGIGPYGTLPNYGASSSLYGTPSNGTTVPIVLSNIANPDLTWETTQQLNIGVDFGFNNGKITGTIDVYDKDTKDLLQQTPIPTSSGFSNMLINRGTLQNKGLELGLDVTVVEKGDFNLSLGGNIAFNKTEIQNLGLTPGDVLMDNGNGVYGVQQIPSYLGNVPSRGNSIKFPLNIFLEGQETALFYGWKTDGIFQSGDTMYRINGSMSQPGDIKVLDLNGDGQVDINDRTIIGNPNPDFIYGINLNMSYKRFNLRALFNGSQGNDIVNGNMYRFGYAEGTYRNVLSEAWNDRWSSENPDGSYPRLGYSSNLFAAAMDRFIEDGSYLRLKNITLNYDVPLSSDNFINSANVYVTGSNLFTWTNYSGYDPEITTFMYDGLIQGVDWNNKPNSRSVLVGVNLTF
ncbi:MAG: SusC/RagA family TonB-linked outer membrane protein [Flavobacteriaceae bacterium]